MRFSPGDTKKKKELIWDLGCLQVPILHFQHSCNAVFFCWHPQGQTSQHLQSPHILRHPVPCQSFPSLPPEMVTLSSFLHLLWPLEIPFPFSSPSYFLDQILVWQVLGFGICVVIDCLAGKTRQLAVELLQQFVTTQIYSSPQCHKTYRNINLGGVYCFVKFFDQQVWKLCGWQNTDVHPHKLTVWSQ